MKNSDRKQGSKSLLKDKVGKNWMQNKFFFKFAIKKRTAEKKLRMERKKPRSRTKDEPKCSKER
jgi:hypothetical protein